MRNLLTLSLLAVVAIATNAATNIYDEAVDARAQVHTGVSEAAKSNVPVLLVFGANWCGDCRVLDLAFKEGKSAPLISKNFKVVKINVGRFDRNIDLAEKYGIPLKEGIPAVAVLSPQGKVVYATKAGELADAGKMGEQGIFEFFSKVTASAK